MIRFVLFCCVLSVPLRADIEEQTSINDVYYRGDHELTGSITLTVNDNDFMGVSPENPAFYHIELDNRALLADTLVDQTSEDPLLSQPIYLACELLSLGNATTLTMSGDAVSIVRWVAGEKEIWVKVQAGSETWLQDSQGQSHGPNADAKVSWTLGISARSSVADHQSESEKNSMRANSRGTDPQTDADAVSTLICVNFSNSNLELGQLLGYELASFGPEAETTLGVYAAINQTFIDFTGDFMIARGKDRNVESQVKGDDRSSSVLVQGNDHLLIQDGFFLELSAESSAGLIDTDFYAGSLIKLASLDNGGFSEGGAWFTDACGSFGSARVVAETAFESNGITLYREIELVWDQDNHHLGDLQLGIGFNLIVPVGHLNGMPQITWSLTLRSHDGDADVAPFDGPDQQRRCQASRIDGGEGEWQPVASIEHDRYLSHITEPGLGYTTSLIFANNSGEEHGYIVSGFAADGSSLGSMAGFLTAGENRVVLAPVLFDDPALSHLRLAAANEVRVSAVYQAVGEGMTPAHLHESAETGTSWLVKRGDKSLTFDAFALINLGATSSRVMVSEIDSAGAAITSSVFDLTPMAKLLHVFDPSAENSEFIIQTTEKSAITALRGNHDSSLIWENRAIPYGRNQLDLPALADSQLARRRDKSKMFTLTWQQAETVSRPKDREGLATITNSFTVQLASELEDEMLYDGTTISLRANAGAGFYYLPSLRSASPCEEEILRVKVDPNSAFQLGNKTLHSQLDFVWAGGTQAVDGFEMTVDATLYQARGLSGPVLVDWVMGLIQQPSGQGEAVFDSSYESQWQIADLTYPRMVPHVTRDGGGFTTEVDLTNGDSHDHVVHLAAFGADGSTLETVALELQGRQSQRLRVSELFSVNGVSHFEVKGHPDIELGVVYRAALEGAGPAHVRTTDQVSSGWVFYAGDPLRTYDGIAVVNMGDSPTEIYLQQRDASGVPVAEPISWGMLESHAKGTLVPSALFEPASSTSYLIYADQDLSVVSLRGDYASTYIWENRAMPTSKKADEAF